MNEFFKMDIFFSVTTMVVFFFGVMGMVALFYMIRILRHINRVARNISEESDALRNDVAVIRTKVHEEGMRVTHLMDFFLGVRERKARARSKKVKE